MTPATTIKILFTAAETHHHASQSAILGRARPATLVHIRHALIHLFAQHHPELTDTQIAHYFYRDRSLITHARHTTRALIETRHQPFLAILAPLRAALAGQQKTPLELLAEAATATLANPANQLTEDTRALLREALAAS